MEEWKEYSIADAPLIPLTDLVEFIVDNRGKTVPTSATGIKLIATNCIRNEYLYPLYEKVRYVTKDTYNTWFRSHPKPGDIIFVNKGTPGKTALVPNPVDFCIAQDMMAFRLKSNLVYNRYLLAVLRSRNLQNFIMNNQVGTIIPHFKKEQLKTLMIPLPDICKQRKIGDLYFHFSEKAEVNRRINENLEQQAQALFKSWFVDFEPFKNGEFVETELGMIPKGWRVGKLGEICNVFTGKKDVKQSQPIGLYPFFSCSPNHTYSNEYICDGPSIIIAGNGSYTGRTSFYFGKFDLYQRTYACTIKEGFNEKIISFLYYMMKCLFEPVKMGGTRGSSIPYIVMNDIVLQKFALDNSLVEKYSDFAYNVMKQIQQNNQESRRLAELRDTLLPKLMSGELRVQDTDLINEMLEKGIR